MNEERFKRMMEAVEQGAEILKGAREPSRAYNVTVRIPDVKASGRSPGQSVDNSPPA